MDTNFTILGNSIIAKYMNLEFDSDHNEYHVCLNGRSDITHEELRIDDLVLNSDNQLMFHRSWDWLMLVVDKIESTHDDFHGFFGVYISANSCTIQGTNLRLDSENPHYAYFNEVIASTKIEATFNAILSWIKWRTTFTGLHPNLI